jgi:hypothetical protein
MIPDDPTRRRFLSAAVAFAFSADAAEALQHAHRATQSGASVTTLAPELAAEIDALACTILPSGDGPGAREAGVIHFIDKALATFDSEYLGMYQRRMEEVQGLRKGMFPASTSIRGLTDKDREALMSAIEPTPFFEILRRHTLMGYLGSPEYGGNRAGVGWAHIGFEDKMAFEPPFGEYDAEAARGAK